MMLFPADLSTGLLLLRVMMTLFPSTCEYDYLNLAKTPGGQETMNCLFNWHLDGRQNVAITKANLQ